MENEEILNLIFDCYHGKRFDFKKYNETGAVLPATPGYQKYLDKKELINKNVSGSKLKEVSLNLNSAHWDSDNFNKISDALFHNDSDPLRCFNFFYEEASCHKQEFVVESWPKIIIVGTISPWNSKEFFYTAPKTRMYKIIDEVLGTNLDSLKNDRKTLEAELNKMGIYFIDVFQEVIRRKRSASDKDIIFASLNYDEFHKRMINVNEKAVVVANSKLAFDMCEEILKQIASDDRFLKQLVKKPCSIFKRDFNEMVEDWKSVFKKAGFKTLQ